MTHTYIDIKRTGDNIKIAICEGQIERTKRTILATMTVNPTQAHRIGERIINTANHATLDQRIEEAKKKVKQT